MGADGQKTVGRRLFKITGGPCQSLAMPLRREQRTAIGSPIRGAVETFRRRPYGFHLNDVSLS
jgi:hypothetical protein